MFNRNKLNIWESVSDMMTGMMMIFLFISLAFMLQLSKIPEEYYGTKAQIVADLRKEFPNNELEEMHAQIDERDGTVSFDAQGATLFQPNGVEPTDYYKKILTEFFPRYVNILYQDKYKDKIVEIRIEGHASIEKNEDRNSQQDYFDNMERSQNRARNVLKYVMQLPIYKDAAYQDWFKNYFTAMGYSFSKATGDNNKDRRVDFKVMVDSESTLNKLSQDRAK